jgi:hypothetical protein
MPTVQQELSIQTPIEIPKTMVFEGFRPIGYSLQ